MDPIATPAPAQVDTPIVATSAVESAVVKNDVAAYREARRAERSGKPLAFEATTEDDGTADVDEIHAAAAPVQPEQPERPLSKRQADINERVRLATAKAVADKDAEIAQLRAQIKPAEPAPRRDAPQAPPTTLADTVQRPEIGKPILNEVDFYTKFPDATGTDYALYVARYDRGAHEAQTEQGRQRQQVQQQQQERATKFHERLAAARTADPDFATKLSPDISGLRPYAAEAEGAEFTVNHAIAEEIVDSEHAPALMLHLSTHPDDLATLRATSSPRALARAIGRLEAKLAAPPQPATPKPNTVTAAPSPGTSLGGKPAAQADAVTSAVTTNNFSKFRAERLQERLAARTGR